MCFLAFCQFDVGKIRMRCKNLKFNFLDTVQVGCERACVCLVCDCLIDKKFFLFVVGAWLLLTTNWIQLHLYFLLHFTYFSCLSLCVAVCCCCFELIHYTLRLHLCFVVTYKEILWDSSVSFSPSSSFSSSTSYSFIVFVLFSGFLCAFSLSSSFQFTHIHFSLFTYANIRFACLFFSLRSLCHFKHMTFFRLPERYE